MADRNSISAYRDAPHQRVRQWLLTVVAQFGELADYLTIVGGLVPSLLIDAVALQVDPHVGTFDIDLAVAVAVDDPSHYLALTERLAMLNFVRADETSIRWTQASPGERPIDIDLLPVGIGAEQQLISNLQPRITRPLELAFLDRQNVQLQGIGILGEQVSARVRVCGPGAFVCIKALTYEDRHLKKDAYDLYYMLHHYGQSVQDVIEHLRPLLHHAQARRAFRILSHAFAQDYEEGCQDVALFLYDRLDANLQADVAGDVTKLLAAFGGET